MGKYLQDIILGVELPLEQKKFSEEHLISLKSIPLLQDLFNYYLPKKIDLGDNIWRIKFDITHDQRLHNEIVKLGALIICYITFDTTSLFSRTPYDRKEILFKTYYAGFINVCEKYKYDPSIFEAIYNNIISDKIVFDAFYKTKKKSPNKLHSAQMRGFYSENFEERKMEVVLFDKNNEQIKTIFVGNYNFQTFDRLEWLNHKTIRIYHINYIQSYKSKKLAEDYFEIDIETGIVTYNPTTRESVFEYGIKLLLENDLYDQAIHYLNMAKTLGHGKADNVLRNLQIDPSLRDKATLLQTPKK